MSAKSVLSLTRRYGNRKGMERWALSASFVAGLFIGIPVTYCLVFLPQRTLREPPEEHESNSNVTRSLTHGVFWSPFAESLVPKGFGEEDVVSWRRFLNSTRALKLEEGCGRMQNRLVALEDGFKACCRYRLNNDQIQGEIFSFYLGRLLGIRNLVPSTLALVDTRTERWSLTASQASLARWSPERPVVLTQFVESLKPAYIPKGLQDSKQRKLHPDQLPENVEDLRELVQWSELVVFDYLTGNLDRVVNNMFNERWNPGMMREPAHNLAKTRAGLLVFLDNESGLLHGYRLLDKYEPFHGALLDALCVFRRGTVEALHRLRRKDHLEAALKTSFAEGDPGMAEWLPFLPEKSLKILQERISHVLKHVDQCKARFGPTPTRIAHR